MASEHIVFDLLDRVLPAALLRWQQRLSQGLTAAVLGGGAWVVWEKAQRTAAYGDHTATLEIPIAPFHTLAAAMLALTALVHLVLAWQGGPAPAATAAELQERA
jgi:TRAP-type C4-dicarboxylate transport system permease small subunit